MFTPGYRSEEGSPPSKAASTTDQQGRSAAGSEGLLRGRNGRAVLLLCGVVATALLLHGRPRPSYASLAGLDQPQAVAVLQQHYTNDDRLLGEMLTGLGCQYIDARQYADALPTFQQAVEALERTDLPRQHVLVCLAHHQLAVVYEELGQSQKSVELDLENLRHREQALGEQHPYVLLTLLNLATAYGELEQYDKSLECAELWLDRNRRGLGERHSQIEQALHLAGAAHLRLRRFEDALECFRQAVEIQQRSGRASTAYTLSNSTIAAIMSLKASPARLAEAEAWTRRSIEIASEVTGRASRESSELLEALGAVLTRQGKHAEAEQALRESTAIDREIEESPLPAAATSPPRSE